MKAAFQILYTSTFLSQLHTKTYWPWEYLCWYGVGDQERVVALFFMRKLRFIKSAIPGGFLFLSMRYQCLIQPEPWADSVSLFTRTAAAKCLLVTKGLGFPICKMGLKPSPQYDMTSYVKVLCKMKKSVLLLIWMPSLHSKHSGDLNQPFHSQGA